MILIIGFYTTIMRTNCLIYKKNTKRLSDNQHFFYDTKYKKPYDTKCKNLMTQNAGKLILKD